MFCIVRFLVEKAGRTKPLHKRCSHTRTDKNKVDGTSVGFENTHTIKPVQERALKLDFVNTIMNIQDH